MASASLGRVPAWTRWLVVAVVAGAILVGSVLPRSAAPVPTIGPGPIGVLGADKWLHALAYAVLAGALLYALAATDRTPRSTIAVTIALAVGFGTAVELVQAPLPTRRFEALDVVANGVGATVAVVVRWAADRFARWTTVGETG